MKDQPKTFLALGDSYTIGESVAQHESWPFQLVNRLNQMGLRFAAPQIIATTGWRTDDLEKAINAASLKPPFDYVSLLIGVNNQYQGKPAAEYETGFQKLLNMAISFAPTASHVVVLSIPDYGFTPFGSEKRSSISKDIDAFNAINKRITTAAGISYVDITPISRKGLEDTALLATDGLHPSAMMYSLWVDAILAGFRFS
jgi:lysophospholipase L1-like esterase